MWVSIQKQLEQDAKRKAEPKWQPHDLFADNDNNSMDDLNFENLKTYFQIQLVIETRKEYTDGEDHSGEEYDTKIIKRPFRKCKLADF